MTSTMLPVDTAVKGVDPMSHVDDDVDKGATKAMSDVDVPARGEWDGGSDEGSDATGRQGWHDHSDEEEGKGEFQRTYPTSDEPNGADDESMSNGDDALSYIDVPDHNEAEGRGDDDGQEDHDGEDREGEFQRTYLVGDEPARNGRDDDAVPHVHLESADWPFDVNVPTHKQRNHGNAGVNGVDLRNADPQHTGLPTTQSVIGLMPSVHGNFNLISPLDVLDPPHEGRLPLFLTSPLNDSRSAAPCHDDPELAHDVSDVDWDYNSGPELEPPRVEPWTHDTISDSGTVVYPPSWGYNSGPELDHVEPSTRDSTPDHQSWPYDSGTEVRPNQIPSHGDGFLSPSDSRSAAPCHDDRDSELAHGVPDVDWDYKSGPELEPPRVEPWTHDTISDSGTEVYPPSWDYNSGPELDRVEPSTRDTISDSQSWHYDSDDSDTEPHLPAWAYDSDSAPEPSFDNSHDRNFWGHHGHNDNARHPFEDDAMHRNRQSPDSGDYRRKNGKRRPKRPQHRSDPDTDDEFSDSDEDPPRTYNIKHHNPRNLTLKVGILTSTTQLSRGLHDCQSQVRYHCDRTLMGRTVKRATLEMIGAFQYHPHGNSALRSTISALIFAKTRILCPSRSLSTSICGFISEGTILRHEWGRDGRCCKCINRERVEGYSITNLPWRSSDPQVTNWFRTFDRLHLTTRYLMTGNPTPGEWPRTRLPSSRIEKHKATPPLGLPENLYDSAFLQSLHPLERQRLKVKPAIDLSFSAEIET
ncbi:hypothetical protein IMY05_C1295000200 [Salix suchowensis]|nr:hypothetical protein IMY05_C1295000200 [Salix suchowensis]